MMRKQTPWLALALLTLAPAALAQKTKVDAPPKKLYCWNENGQRVCSDALPPEAVNYAREEISAKSGLRTGEVNRTLTAEERAQAAAEAAQRALDKAAEDTRRRTDQAMLMSYRTEDDLRRVFNERTAIVDNNVQTARYNVASLREGLISLLQTAGDRELSERPVSAEMTQNIRLRHAELVRQRQLQASFESQRGELDIEIEDILQRYRTMKGSLPADSAPAATTP
ncbi:hypothetical protein SAMN06296416_105114 [Pseudoxanthomonas wuyuanensis]|uniref:DUF4124 domain-containing protein n=2 Tax=Pseudoxanthomonas wuyuanensis TaxID=1073196 RepID=A0A286D849_9GAMM|nr:hypothetical protein SAMN06296416_105114 [Pseudoxanthomonas wuyuanensis]